MVIPVKYVLGCIVKSGDQLLFRQTDVIKPLTKCVNSYVRMNVESLYTHNKFRCFSGMHRKLKYESTEL